MTVKMHVNYILEDFSEVSGGVPAVVNQLSRRVANYGWQVNVVHTSGDGMLKIKNIEIERIMPSGLGSPWGWSTQLRPTIERLAALSGPKVFHLHGIWSAPQYFGANVAKKCSIPLVLSAHGMLEPWLWKRQGWKIWGKKKVYWELFAHQAFRSASVVHAVTPLEREHLQQLFPSNRIEVITNAIDLDEYGDTSSTSQRERLILFVGRIEPIKGVDILLKAFAMANITKDWRVVVMGPVWSSSYQAELERIVSDACLENRISFIGALFGQEKQNWFRKAWILVVPSHSEVVGLVNLEAAAHYVPSITTHQTGLGDWERGGGILIQPEVYQLRDALERVCSWSDSERTERGAASRNLVSERYSWKVVLPQWLSLYGSLLSKG